MKVCDEYELLETILNIPSVNGVDDEGETARFIYNYLKGCNVDCQVIPIDSTHSDIIAYVKGKSDEFVIWNGHLDTVPYGKAEEWNSMPGQCMRRDNRYYARGASDMKSGLAAMVYVLGTMNRMGVKPKTNLCFIGTCDEEKGGIGAGKIVMENMMPQASLLFIGEPTGLELGVAQKGCMWIELIVEGVTSHGAYPWEGVNAVEHGMEIAAEFKRRIGIESHNILGHATAQITKIQGGIAPNMTPDHVEILMDVRIIPGLDPESVLEILKDICRMHFTEPDRRGSCSFRVLNQRKAIEIEEQNPWIGCFDHVLEQMGLSARRVGINYFTDASILTEIQENLPVLLLGPGEPGMAHKPNEYVELEKYVSYIHLLKKVFFMSFENE